MANSDKKQSKDTKDKVQLDAISYIKSSSFFSDSKNEWILPLVNEVLEDNSLDDKSIKSVVLGEVDSEDQKEKNTVQLMKGLRYEVVQQDIQSITEISSIKNIGLLNRDIPLKLEDGLNIFFGKNGAGKSSIYLGLCKLFGKNKKVLPDLEKVNSSSECTVRFKNKKGEETDLIWKTGESNVESPVMIFDGEISQLLVEQDQDNKFEIAHLKLEYFSYLRVLYERIESIISDKITEKETAISNTETTLSPNLPLLSKMSIEEVETQLSNPLTKEEELNFNGLLKQKETLEKDNSDATLRNLNTAKNSLLNNILTRFGKKDESGNWILSYDKSGIATINEQIENIQKAQKAFEESGMQKIKSLIPESWISDDTWTDFIDKSIEFLESLDEDSQNKYKNELCIYCQQPLATPESIRLVGAYSELKSEIESKIKSERLSLKGVGNIVNTCIQNLNNIISTNQVIEAEFESLGRDKKEKISIDTNVLVSVLERVKNNINDITKINLSNEEERRLLSFYEEYKTLFTELETKSTELEKAIGDKKDSLSKLKNKIKPLEERKNVDKNRKALETYTTNKKELARLKARLSDIYTLKQTLSRAESGFSEVAGLKEFKKCLEDEYKKLCFSPPNYWKISPITRDGVNKRVYRLNDKQLSDIFSEGERKLHSLADFFAQCQVNKYRGVYIFDDPVNSLDEPNTELVAERIVELANNGNQVIVFTHNLFFMNELLDRSNNKKVNEITKECGQIVIEMSVSKTDTPELKKVLGKIEKKMKELSSKTSIDEDDIRFVYNYISEYLEYYVELVLFRNIVHRHRANIMMGSLDKLNIDNELVKNISKLHKKTSRKSVRHAQTHGVQMPTHDELKIDVEYIKTNLKW